MALAKQSKNKELATQFLNWATNADLAKRGMLANITMARISAWQDKDVLAKVNPGLVETQVFAAQNGNPFDRPYMSAVGEARDLIGEVVIESIDTKGESPKLAEMAKERAAKVNELLKDTGEYGK
jgi:multiple sugar transport system substrate-binding protein